MDGSPKRKIAWNSSGKARFSQALRRRTASAALASRLGPCPLFKCVDQIRQQFLALARRSFVPEMRLDMTRPFLVDDQTPQLSVLAKLSRKIARGHDVWKCAFRRAFCPEFSETRRSARANFARKYPE